LLCDRSKLSSTDIARVGRRLRSWCTEVDLDIPVRRLRASPVIPITIVNGALETTVIVVELNVDGIEAGAVQNSAEVGIREGALRCLVRTWITINSREQNIRTAVT
jgi:hypothetical protein